MLGFFEYMAQYTVRPGDTLSGIGARHGVDWHGITGYRSGNPNLIFPGEVLNIPERQGATQPPPQQTSGGGGQQQQQQQAPQIVIPPAFNPQEFVKALEESQAKTSAAQKAEREALLAQQKKSEEEFLGRYTGAVTSLEPIAAIANRLSQELGIPGLSEISRGLNEAIIDLEDLLAGLPGRVAQETRGFDVSASQLARLQEARGIPLRGQLIEVARGAERVGGRLGSLQTELGQRLGFATEEQRRTLLPYQVEAELLSTRLAREITLFTEERERELSSLLGKLNAGVQLSIADANRAAQLAIAEQDFIIKRQTLNQGVLTTGQGGQRLLINPNTGAVLANLGASEAAKAGGAGAGGIAPYLEKGRGSSVNDSDWPSGRIIPQSERRGGFGPTTQYYA